MRDLDNVSDRAERFIYELTTNPKALDYLLSNYGGTLWWDAHKQLNCTTSISCIHCAFKASDNTPMCSKIMIHGIKEPLEEYLYENHPEEFI